MRNAFSSSLAARKWNGCLKNSGQLLLNNPYREVAFRYLLESETRRSKRSGHTCRILLVYRIDTQGAVVPMGPHLSRLVIEALSGNLRATDYIGWYREEHIVGALLATMRGDSLEDRDNGLQLRLQERLRAGLTPERDMFRADPGLST
ncbi:MAG: hypothetical protein QM706_08990 [Nitrospira sp.]